MIKIKSNETLAWMEEDNSKLVMVAGLGTDERHAMENLADKLHGLSVMAMNAAHNLSHEAVQK